MYLVAAALLGLIAVLATLQYRWLGRISEAEGERRRAALSAQAAAFAADFDRELTRAYLLFQFEPGQPDAGFAERVAGRFDRWQATAQFPALVEDVYVVRDAESDTPWLEQYVPSGRLLQRVDWPPSMRGLRELSTVRSALPAGRGTFIRSRPPSIWEDIPAIVVPMPMVLLNPQAGKDQRHPSVSYAVLVLDREYIAGTMLPALAAQHFDDADGQEFQLAVVSAAKHDVLYRSAPEFSPSPDASVDARLDLFHVRPQEFGGMVSEIRRFSAVLHAVPSVAGERVHRDADVGTATLPRGANVSIFTFDDHLELPIALDQKPGAGGRSKTAFRTATTLAARAAAAPKWRLLVQHRAGSLEAAVDAARRRNLGISTGILALLGISVGFLVVSTRRAQQLARQQMEFVAAVSHELRTPLAVIHSAGENLADGVVYDQGQIRRYGELVRGEGRRLTAMVEQILEFAGTQSGQRSFALRPVAVRPLLDEVVDSSRALIDAADLRVEYEIPPDLPPVVADEASLRRVFQNLVGNAVKYGASGDWIRLRARADGREVRISVADHGIGIPPAEQAKIFEPFYRTADVIAAQVQGAGLGLSLVKRTVESLGGRVTVRSAEGQGSEFTVHLPAATEDTVARRAPGARPIAGPASHG